MQGFDKISTDIIQVFTASEAWNYMLVPFHKEDRTIKCFADKERDYSAICQEVEIIFELSIKLSPIDKIELTNLLSQYYRKSSIANKHTTINSATDSGFLISIIEEAFDIYASDIHVEQYEEKARVRMRIDGKLIERYVIPRTNYGALVNQIKILSNLDISEKRLPQDGRILFNRKEKKFDVRVSCLPTIYGEKVVMRLLTRHVEFLELSNLGFTKKQLHDYWEAILKPHGLVLICGPTGSGKSTTLYATLRQLNDIKDNILTIEDPVEYTLEGVNQVQLKEEIGLSFPIALKTFLRQDPDIIMLGEIRDADTAQMAIRSSLTGHLIFSTIHTNSAWGCVSRLVDMGVHSYLISDTLVMCVAQRLVRLLCPVCKQETDVDNVPGLDGIRKVYKAVGCNNCYHIGYKSRKAVYEVIPIDSTLVNEIRNNAQDIDSYLKQKGIVTMRQAAVGMLRSGETSLEEIIQIINS